MNDVLRDYKEIRKDFEIDDSIFNAEPDKVRRIKEIVLNRLDQVERTLILLYADCGSLRDLGKRLGMSYGSVKRVLDPIKEKILKEYYEMTAKEIKERL
mgnify:CR=1 FL=1